MILGVFVLGGRGSNRYFNIVQLKMTWKGRPKLRGRVIF